MREELVPWAKGELASSPFAQAPAPRACGRHFQRSALRSDRPPTRRRRSACPDRGHLRWWPGGIHPRAAESGGQIRRQEPSAQRAEQLAIKLASVLEADFHFRGMHIHVHGFCRHFEFQKRHRVTSREQQPTIRLLQRMLEGSIADCPAVEKQILGALVAAALAGIGHIAGSAPAVAAFDPNQVGRQVRAKEGRDPRQAVAPAADRTPISRRGGA